MGDLGTIALGVAVTFVLMMIVTNKKLRKIIDNILNKRIFKTRVFIKDILVIATILVVEVVSVKLLMKTKITLKYTTEKDEYREKVYEESQKIIDSQSLSYKNLMKTETNVENCKNPYIPEGFKYVEGEWNTGFVIEDENQNQFVWVPTTNQENTENIPLLKKKTFMKDGVSQSYFECFEESDIDDFITSVLDNGGFYISRYEMSNEDGKPASKSGKEVWVNINYNDANKLARNMYDNINSRLLNGYAYDVAVNFSLDEVNYDDVPRGTGISGNRSYKNIYDLIDDYGEWTEEQKYGSRIFRRTAFYEDDMLFCDRFSEDENSIYEILTFRTIIYK